MFQDYAAFQFLFKYVACTRADRIGYVKLEEAVGFAREAGLHHGRLTIDAVYDRASIEEDKVDDKPGAKADASKPVRDDRAPDRLLSRGKSDYAQDHDMLSIVVDRRVHGSHREGVAA